MALPIKPTPKLNESESEQFRQMIEKADQKSGPKGSREKVEQAKEKAALYASGRKKQGGGNMATQKKSLDVMVFFSLLQSLQNELDGEVTIKQMQILCLVSRFPGITSKQIVDYVGLHPTALSRAFRGLSLQYKRDRQGNKVLKGHNLIEARPSLEGGRQFSYYLTAKGQHMLDKVGLRNT